VPQFEDGGATEVDDRSWRNLSAVLGVACVILIIAAGALLYTSGESPAPTPQPGGSVAVESPSDSGESTPPDGSPSESGAPTPEASPTATLAPSHIASITFNDLQLDAMNDPLGKARTFTFITDGNGPVGIAITKSNPAKWTTRICARVDGSKQDCRTGTRITYTGAFTDTTHSVWVVTLIGNQGATPTVDVAFSWPAINPRITLTHGRLQGSSTPGIPEALNGLTATTTPKVDGNIGLAASWTTITTDVRVATDETVGTSSNLLDQKAYTGVQNLGTPGYTYGVNAGKTYRLSLRDLSADSGRPDLTAVISLP
jgi:hypothetical protein